MAQAPSGIRPTGQIVLFSRLDLCCLRLELHGDSSRGYCKAGNLELMVNFGQNTIMVLLCLTCIILFITSSFHFIIANLM